MRRALLAVFLLIAAALLAEDTPPLTPVPERYALSLGLDFEKHAVQGEATITFKNTGPRPLRTVPFILYRLMDVTSVTGPGGERFHFTQRVVKFSDDETWQVNAIDVRLSAPLGPGRSTTATLKYAGPLLGLREVMQYVRDTVDKDYSLLRAETIPFPMLSLPSYGGWSRFLHNRMRIELSTAVPGGYTAVCVLPAVGEPNHSNAIMTFRCAGDGDGSSINVAVAKFHVLKDHERNLAVYAMPADAEAAERVLSEMRRSLDFFRSYFGEVSGTRGLTLVEIPEGWGSYGMSGTIFQAGAAFKNKDSANELWHEVSHRWNACASMDSALDCDRLVQRSRWFDEAFASFFEAIAIRQFNGPDAFQKDMEASRKYFIQRCEREPRGRTTPIAEYGKHEIGGFSYTKGAWSLYVLQQYLGEEQFRRAISAFLAEYAGKPVQFEDFRRSVERSTGRDLGPWFEQWILSGPESSEMLLQGRSAEEMVARIQPASGKK
jgi:hypothetical protein